MIIQSALVAVSLLSAMPAIAADVIRCQHPGTPDVIITLNERKAFKHTLSCIKGPMVADMTGCAPTGGYGLSAPTGSVPLIGVVDRWQDYGDAPGAIVGFDMSANALGFQAGHMSDGGYKSYWRFEVDRLTGTGTLKEDDPEQPPVAFTCVKMTPRF